MTDLSWLMWLSVGCLFLALAIVYAELDGEDEGIFGRRKR